MKKYLINLVIFILPGLCMFVILEYSTRNYNTKLKQKQMYLSENSDSIEVLILGNSHAGDGLNPVLFNLNACNAAEGSQSLYFDIEITKKYLTKMTRLKYVLISVDYHSLYFTHSTQRDFMYSNYYGIDYKNNFPLRSHISLLFYGYGLKNGLSMLRKEQQETVKGYVGFSTTNYDDLNELSGKRRVESFNKNIKENIHNKNEIIDNLNDFIKLLKNRNVMPILLTLPCHNFYNSNLDYKIVAQNKRDIENICKQNDIKYLNYLYENLADTCFYNVDHLNEKGALIISKKINNEILLLEEV